MKIRLQGNSIRFRVTRSEVQTLAEKGLLLEETHLGPGADQCFSYALETKDDIDSLRADIRNARITMYIPAADAKTWPSDQRVGFERTVQLTPDTSLFLLLEKDFVCLDAPIEDQSDNYPNPHYEQKDGSQTGVC